MPLRSVMMKRFILGFQRRVWGPKGTPLSRSWRMVTTAMGGRFLLSWSGQRELPNLFSVRRRRREPPALVPGATRPSALGLRADARDAPERGAEDEHAKSTRTGCSGDSRSAPGSSTNRDGVSQFASTGGIPAPLLPRPAASARGGPRERPPWLHGRHRLPPRHTRR